MQRKGINYDVGIEFHQDYLSRPTFDSQIIHRELEIIRDDLHCNAVRISGTDVDRLIVAAEDALGLGLEVWLSPTCMTNLHKKPWLTPSNARLLLRNCARKPPIWCSSSDAS